MSSGQRLISEVNAFVMQEGEAGLWWLGQHGFILKFGDTVVYVDAFLSPHEKRLVQPLLQPEQVTNADAIIGTHDHGDHVDRPAWPVMASASPQALFVIPDLQREAVARDLRIPPDRFVGLDEGTTLDVKGITITGVASAHEFLDQDLATGRYPYVGCVIEANGCAVYHSGDCCVYEGLVAKLRQWKLDAVLLPINGRDATRLRRNCIGNMTYQEAADLAGALQPGLTIPAHFDMFANNGEDPQLFLDYFSVKYPHLRAHTCAYGELVRISAYADPHPSDASATEDAAP